jgi:hypothetical protein
MSGGAASRGRSHPGLRPLANLSLRVGRLLPAADAWIGPGSVMKEMSRMSPPHAGHSRGNASPTRAISFAHAIRDVSWERGFWFASQQPSEP